MSEGRERCQECGRSVTPEERKARWTAAISEGQKRAWRALSFGSERKTNEGIPAAIAAG